MTLIIFCHPSHDSHNGEILKKVINTLESGNKTFQILDLYHMGFDPLLSPEEYERIKNRAERGPNADVVKMQELVLAAKTLIFIYPTWWYNMPAMLKGFFDRVFSSRFAYRFFAVHPILMFGADILSYIPGVRYLMQTHSVTPLLKGKKALIFRTYGGPKTGKRMFGNAPNTVLENVILRFCGITDITTRELFNIDKSSVFREEDFQKYLDKVTQICRKI